MKRRIMAALLALGVALGVVAVGSSPASATIRYSPSPYVEMSKCVYWPATAYKGIQGINDWSYGAPYWRIKYRTVDYAHAPGAPAEWAAANYATYHLQTWASGTLVTAISSPTPGSWYRTSLQPGGPEPSGVQGWVTYWGDAWPPPNNPWWEDWHNAGINVIDCNWGYAGPYSW